MQIALGLLNSVVSTSDFVNSVFSIVVLFWRKLTKFFVSFCIFLNWIDSIFVFFVFYSIFFFVSEYKCILRTMTYILFSFSKHIIRFLCVAALWIKFESFCYMEKRPMPRMSQAESWFFDAKRKNIQLFVPFKYINIYFKINARFEF